MLVIDPQVTLVYSIYLGGSRFDTARAIAMDDDREAFVAGYTKSPDFPGVRGQPQDSKDAFVAKLSADGQSLVYASFIGGTGGSGVTAHRDVSIFPQPRPPPSEAAFAAGAENTIQIPATMQAIPAARAIRPPHGVSFSRSTSNARSAIQSTFITPTTNRSAIRTQQQPTQ